MTLSAKFGEKNIEIKMVSVGDLSQLVVDPEVQRNLDKSHARKLEQYLYDGLTTAIDNVFLAPLVGSARPDGKISVNDGQHRLEGLTKLVINLSDKALKLKKKCQQRNVPTETMQSLQQEKSEIEYALKKLKSWSIPIMIYHNLSKDEERQLFHDLNNTPKKPPTSISLQFDSSDLYTRLAKEMVKEVKGFEGEVDWGNKNTGKTLFLFSVVFNSVVRLLGRKKADKIDLDNYAEKKETARSFFEIFFKNLPEDAKDSKKYLHSFAPTLQGLAKYANFLLSLKDKKVDWEATFERSLQDQPLTHTNPLLVSLGKFSRNAETGQIIFRGSGASIDGIANTLKGSAIFLDYDGNEVVITDMEVDQSSELSQSETQLNPDLIEEEVKAQEQVTPVEEEIVTDVDTSVDSDELTDTEKEVAGASDELTVNLDLTGAEKESTQEEKASKGKGKNKTDSIAEFTLNLNNPQ